MKIWKILDFKSEHGIACYAKVNENTLDGDYKALQLARKTIKHSLCTTQLLDTNIGEKMIENIPVLEYKED